MTKEKEMKQVLSIAKAIGATLLLLFGRQKSISSSGHRQPYDAAEACGQIDQIATHYKIDDLES